MHNIYFWWIITPYYWNVTQLYENSLLFSDSLFYNKIKKIVLIYISIKLVKYVKELMIAYKIYLLIGGTGLH